MSELIYFATHLVAESCALDSEAHAKVLAKFDSFLNWQISPALPKDARDVLTVFSNGRVVVNSIDIFTKDWLITFPGASVTAWRRLIKGIDTP